MKEISKCPKCGREVEIHGGKDFFWGDEEYYIKCDCGFEYSHKDCSYDYFVDLWNEYCRLYKIPFKDTGKRTKTNFEIIHNMTDEQLARFLIEFENKFGEEYEGEMSCLDWLRKPYNGDI